VPHGAMVRLTNNTRTTIRYLADYDGSSSAGSLSFGSRKCPTVGHRSTPVTSMMFPDPRTGMTNEYFFSAEKVKPGEEFEDLLNSRSKAGSKRRVLDLARTWRVPSGWDYLRGSAKADLPQGYSLADRSRGGVDQSNRARSSGRLVSDLTHAPLTVQPACSEVNNHTFRSSIHSVCHGNCQETHRGRPLPALD